MGRNSQPPKENTVRHRVRKQIKQALRDGKTYKSTFYHLSKGEIQALNNPSRYKGDLSDSKVIKD